MSPRATTVQEIYALLDSVQVQLQQIRQKAKELVEVEKKKEEGSSND